MPEICHRLLANVQPFNDCTRTMTEGEMCERSDLSLEGAGIVAQ
jgi:hypothetical protein